MSNISILISCWTFGIRYNKVLMAKYHLGVISTNAVSKVLQNIGISCHGCYISSQIEMDCSAIGQMVRRC